MSEKPHAANAGRSDPTVLAFKVRITFGRDELGSYYPHQSVLGAFERAVRRAGIPVRFTEGFDPRPRISLPYALSVGIPGDCEVLEIELCEFMKPSQVAAALNEFLPRGVRCSAGRLVAARRSSFEVLSMTFQVELPPELREQAAKGARRLLDSREFVVVRGEGSGKRREVDIRPFLLDLRVGGDVLVMRIAFTRTGSAKPREVVEAVLADAAAGLDLRLLKIRKTALEIKDAD